MSRSSRIGVGILGAGTATQAVHLPALAHLSADFELRHVSDPNPHPARKIAEAHGCSWSEREEDLLADPRVEVVVICSPNAHHAPQVVAACQAGKRAVLCEKPLAQTHQEAHEVLSASRSTGVPVVSGAMLAFDPAVRQARLNWGDLPEACRLVRSTTYLPPNDVMIAAATEPSSAQPRPARSARPSDETRADVLRSMLLGLAGHHMPLLRALLSDRVVVTSAQLLEPLGYLVTAAAGASAVQLISLWPGQWPVAWSMEALAPDQRLWVRYPPSFVMSGSSTTTLEATNSRRTWIFEENGYLQQWRRIAALVRNEADLHIDVESAVADAELALDLSGQAADLYLRGGR